MAMVSKPVKELDNVELQTLVSEGVKRALEAVLLPELQRIAKALESKPKG